MEQVPILLHRRPGSPRCSSTSSAKRCAALPAFRLRLSRVAFDSPKSDHRGREGADRKARLIQVGEPEFRLLLQYYGNWQAAQVKHCSIYDVRVFGRSGRLVADARRLLERTVPRNLMRFDTIVLESGDALEFYCRAFGNNPPAGAGGWTGSIEAPAFTTG